jgi:hypothetical protein
MAKEKKVWRKEDHWSFRLGDGRVSTECVGVML